MGHLAAGLSHLEFLSFDLYRVNPPLVRSIAAVPVWLSSVERDWSKLIGGHFDRPEFLVGRALIDRNGPKIFPWFSYGRLACIPFSVLAGWVCYLWSSRLFGERAGFAAAVMWSFLPEAMANGQMITPDAAAASMGIVFCYACWRYHAEPSWLRAGMVGVALGLALLTKTTWLVAFPVLLLTVLLNILKRPAAARVGSRLKHTAFVIVLGIYVLNLGYLFEGTGTPLGEFPFVSTTLSGEPSRISGNRFEGTWLGQLPVPLPRNFVRGIDVQKYEFDEREYSSYLRGEWQDHGWWYYYLYGLCIKTPIGFLILGGWALYMASRRVANHDVVDIATLLLPGVLILLLVSSETGFNHHLRYVLPAAPYFVVLASMPFSTNVASGDWHSKQGGDQRTSTVVAVAFSLLLWGVVSSFVCIPHSQSFFNELVGGPRNGPKHLLNSNVDWGQDVHRVREWLARNRHVTELSFAPYCNFNINAVDPIANWKLIGTKAIEPGWYALSVNQLYRRDGRYAFFTRLEPVDSVGYSTYIYKVSAEDLRPSTNVATSLAGKEQRR